MDRIHLISKNRGSLKVELFVAAVFVILMIQNQIR